MLKLFTGTIYDLRSCRLELICLLESSSLLRLRRGVAGLLRIMTFTWKHQVFTWWLILVIISTCSSIWSRFCLEFLRFSLDAAVDILNCLRASSSCDMGRVWVVVAELGSLRPTETSYKHLKSVNNPSKLTPSVDRHKLGFVDVISFQHFSYRRQHYLCVTFKFWSKRPPTNKRFQNWN